MYLLSIGFSEPQWYFDAKRNHTKAPPQTSRKKRYHHFAIYLRYTNRYRFIKIHSTYVEIKFAYLYISLKRKVTAHFFCGAIINSLFLSI